MGAGEKLQQPPCESDSGIIPERLSFWIGAVVREAGAQLPVHHTNRDQTHLKEESEEWSHPPTHTLCQSYC